MLVGEQFLSLCLCYEEAQKSLGVIERAKAWDIRSQVT